MEEGTFETWTKGKDIEHEWFGIALGSYGWCKANFDKLTEDDIHAQIRSLEGEVLEENDIRR